MAGNITKAEIRMYRLGTGDCFAVKFFAGNALKFKMMIDAGAWSGSKADITPYIEDLKEYIDNHVDLLVITHEHKDHVHAFDVCEELFTNGNPPFTVDQIWMAWTEDEKSQKVKNWKKKYGEQKMALAMAGQKLKEAVASPGFKKQFEEDRNGFRMLSARQSFAGILTDFADLHLSSELGVYKGGLKGMEVVKNQIADNNIKYFGPGDIIEDIDGLPGIKFYVLGPPRLFKDVETEAGGEGECYEHNKVLEESGAFSAAIAHEGNTLPESLLPFDRSYVQPEDSSNKLKERYEQEEWRKVDHDWLFGGGQLALRMNSLTNNLSLALAIEFEDSKKIMLFPGDAEYGSWASWHKINWTVPSNDPNKHLTEDILNRTVFYKVAHHISHNGTAKKQGLEMMMHKDLAAMATLDYNIISSGWKTTMPNRAIIKELLSRTKGRLMIMRENDLFYDFNEEVPLSDKIKEARNKMSDAEETKFKNNYKENDLFLQYTVNGQ